MFSQRVASAIGPFTVASGLSESPNYSKIFQNKKYSIKWDVQHALGVWNWVAFSKTAHTA
jgi:hypothetical protein